MIKMNDLESIAKKGTRIEASVHGSVKGIY